MPDSLPPVVAYLLGDASSALDAIDEVEKRLAAFASKDWTANLDINQAALDAGVANAIAKIESIPDKTVTVTVKTDLSALSALTSMGGAAAAGGAAGAAGAGAAGGSGILGTLLWGGGGIMGIGAGIGSVMSQAGFGLEHLITTTLGLLCSAVGGMLGGGLLAAGSLGGG